ncbi:MAG TPA: GSCFA domain-containing protein [Bacteroidia bacterium]|nr:GSCFA domain-containing protein [Bacteroidia bacterium]
MQFHLNYNHPKQDFDITHESKLFMMGSCFAENIGDKLNELKFNCTLNPNGILFNPISIATALSAYINNTILSEEEVVFNNELYHSFNHHGAFSCGNKEELIHKINHNTRQAHNALKHADVLLITFGTSNVYVNNANSEVVANCHKFPQHHFTKEQLQPGEIINRYEQLIEDLKVFNPKLKIIFTVSPVKYLKDGLIENNLSKAVLIYSIHEILKQHSYCSYFPAYELVTDDLRDYRFYKTDMAHPNEQAIEYVWDKFSVSYFTESTLKIIQKVKEIKSAMNHRPLKESTLAHAEFKKSFLQKCMELEKALPDVSFEIEKKFFAS